MLANLTIKVDDEVLRRARIRALERGTSVNSVLAEHLARFAGDGDVQEQAIAALLAHAAPGDADLERARERGGRRWTREQLHER